MTTKETTEDPAPGAAAPETPQEPVADQGVAAAVATYSAALTPIVAGFFSAEALLETLLARDRLARALSCGEGTPAQLNSALSHDARLQSDAGAIVRGVGRSLLNSWRLTRLPPAESWWWWLDRLTDESQSLTFGWWLLAALFCAFVGITLALEISFRLLGVGADLVALSGITSQFVLAVLAGSTLTHWGRHNVRRGFLMMGLGPRYHPHGIVILAAVFLALMVFARLNLGWLAGCYSRCGKLAESQGLLTTAISDYERALQLDPGSAEAHYNLAFDLETVHDNERAASEYQKAIQRSDDFYPAYNNLARLLIRERKDLSGALGLLETALRKQPPETRVRYSLLKNRGWANLALGLLVRAEEDLRLALKLRRHGAAAHCLLAQTLEAKADRHGALEEWVACVAFAGGQEAEVEPAWLATGQERIEESYKQ
jgi:tetratricopeptide (TPR) repeat protein